MSRQDGRKYTGRWKEGLRDGEGTEVEADGVAQYSGEWVSDQSKLGKGKMVSRRRDEQWSEIFACFQQVYSDGSTYDGAWKEQKYHGFGIFQSAGAAMFSHQPSCADPTQMGTSMSANGSRDCRTG